ncbi:MAG: hypothetical protein U0401_29230 [Anaerolineae bacterium]
MSKKNRIKEPTFYLLTLGCPKNVFDSEGMSEMLLQANYNGVTDPRQADVLIVNTCGFLQAAKDESIATLQDLAASKKKHQLLIAAGCMAQRFGSEVTRGQGFRWTYRHKGLDRYCALYSKITGRKTTRTAVSPA